MISVNVFESIADRRIREARAAGLFDDLPLRGKPIPDLDRERPPGWWADRTVRLERHKLAAEELDAAVRTAMPDLWRSTDEGDLRAKVDDLNAKIDAYNQVTTWERRGRLDPGAIAQRWQRLGRAQPDPR
jgi:hypothetical protein